MGERIKKQTLRSAFLTYHGLSCAFVLYGFGSLLFCFRLEAQVGQGLCPLGAFLCISLLVFLLVIK